MPTVKMMPAIPGKVKVASKMVNIPTSKNKFTINAAFAIKPKILYLMIMKIITKPNPIIREIIPEFIESCP